MITTGKEISQAPFCLSARTAIIAWTVFIASVCAWASVPEYRWPWSHTAVLREVSGEWRVSDPILKFATPYLSSATARFPARPSGSFEVVILDGSDALTTAGMASHIALRIPSTKFAMTESGRLFTWTGRPQQFAPVDTIRVGVRLDPQANPELASQPVDVSIGYDAVQPAVRAIHFWWPILLALYGVGLGCSASASARSMVARQVVRARRFCQEDPTLLGILIVSAAVRWLLAWQGGQYFDWDELRYANAAEIFELASTGNISAAGRFLLNTPDHPGYRIAAFIPALLHTLPAWLAGRPVSETRWPSGEWLPAGILAMTSVAIIVLVYALVKRTGGSTVEARIAAVLAAASSSLIVYARHLMPYDAAMAILLTGLWIGLKRATALRTYASGLLAGCAFLTYEGTWTAVLAIGFVIVCRKPLTAIPARIAAFGAGTLTVPGAMMLGSAALGLHLYANMKAFASQVTNGDFGEGWRLPWLYLFTADTGTFVVYVLGVALTIYLIAVAGRGSRSSRGATWISVTAIIYALLIVGSNIRHQFVVYDRLARQLVPFMCLAAAYGFTRLMDVRPGLARWKRVVGALCGIVVLVSFSNRVWLLTIQRYPREVAWEAIQRVGVEQLRLASTVQYSDEATVEAFLPEALRNSSGRPARYVLLNAKDLWLGDREPEWVRPPDGRVIVRARHPRELTFMQYHGFTPVQRAKLRELDFSIALVDTGEHPR